MEKKLYRSRQNRVFTGVLGGIGEYFNIDPTLLRLIFLLVVIFTALIPGIIFYILAFALMPIKR
ncbi:MAG: PspC domain-containing protein [Candidatus Harrisonbacteria bacterium]|nr:PspC domain-containing protein [Candidatus Harrisonbacteria bacterium]